MNSNKVIPYWRLKALHELNNQKKHHKDLIKKFYLEKNKIKLNKNSHNLSIRDYGELISKYDSPKTNEMYIRLCNRRIELLESTDIDEKTYYSIAIVF